MGRRKMLDSIAYYSLTLKPFSAAEEDLLSTLTRLILHIATMQVTTTFMFYLVDTPSKANLTSYQCLFVRVLKKSANHSTIWPDFFSYQRLTF